MKVYILAASLVFVASSGNAHSIKSAYCNAIFRVGQPMLNILVQPNGDIIVTGGARALPLTVQVKQDGNVNFFRPSQKDICISHDVPPDICTGSLIYENVTMEDGKLHAIYHQLASRGGFVGEFTAPCIMR